MDFTDEYNIPYLFGSCVQYIYACESGMHMGEVGGCGRAAAVAWRQKWELVPGCALESCWGLAVGEYGWGGGVTERRRQGKSSVAENW